MDSQDFADIEKYGEERWLGELADKLHRKTYRAEAVRRVWIPKSDGRKRPLGIPCIADRTVMTAAVVVLTPIFEVDMRPNSMPTVPISNPNRPIAAKSPT